jgi:hypothetical protein
MSFYSLKAVYWLKDGRPLGHSDPVLKITSVGKNDRGMYQCFVRNDKESAQVKHYCDTATCSCLIIFKEYLLHMVFFKYMNILGNRRASSGWQIRSSRVRVSVRRANRRTRTFCQPKVSFPTARYIRTIGGYVKEY